jgi:hypothetical protein
MHGLRMEGRQRIVRIRFKAEHLAAAARPLGAGRMGLVHSQCMRHHAAIAETVEHRPSMVVRDSPQDVRVMADHQIRAGCHGGLCQFAFVGRDHRRRVHDSLVKRDHHQTRGLAGDADVLGQPFTCKRIHLINGCPR